MGCSMDTQPALGRTNPVCQLCDMIVAEELGNNEDFSAKFCEVLKQSLGKKHLKPRLVVGVYEGKENCDKFARATCD